MRRVLVVLMLLFAAASVQGGTLLVLGDSLSAGYGLPAGQGWVALLQQRLEREGLSYQVINASISGDTSAGGLARLDASLDQYQPELLLLALGANDGLRGLSLAAMKGNLSTIVRRAKGRGVQVLLIGMELPPNYGQRYTERFRAVYRELATECGLPLVPFLLEGVVFDPALMQADDLHPNARAQPQLLETVWPVLAPLLQPATEGRD